MSSQRPYFIGVAGGTCSGKTTVSKQLVQLLPRTAHVEVDDLREFIEWMPLTEAIPLCLQAAADVTRWFTKANLNVVISWPLFQDGYDYLLRELTPLGTLIHCVTLSPSMAVALTNRGTRELTEWELRRIPYHYETGINSPPFGIVIDNTRQTPDETARQILEHVKE